MYPHEVKIIRTDNVLIRYCGVRLGTKWRARIAYYNEGTKKIPRIIMAIYIQSADAPLGEVRLYDREVRFLNGLPKPIK